MSENQFLKKNDVILIVCLLIAGGLLALAVFLKTDPGAVVLVKVDGRTEAVFPLNENAGFDIAGADGGHNRLVIENGEARIDEADCPDGLCRRMGKISKNGQSIICLPHKVVVEISGETAASDVDVTVR